MIPPRPIALKRAMMLSRWPQGPVDVRTPPASCIIREELTAAFTCSVNLVHEAPGFCVQLHQQLQWDNTLAPRSNATNHSSRKDIHGLELSIHRWQIGRRWFHGQLFGNLSWFADTTISRNWKFSAGTNACLQQKTSQTMGREITWKESGVLDGLISYFCR